MCLGAEEGGGKREQWELLGGREGGRERERERGREGGRERERERERRRERERGKEGGEKGNIKKIIHHFTVHIVHVILECRSFIILERFSPSTDHSRTLLTILEYY